MIGAFQCNGCRSTLIRMLFIVGTLLKRNVMMNPL